MRNARLSVNTLTQVFRSTRVLDSISFEIKAGELVGIIGPNGVGKSTLLKSLINYLPVKSGVVFVDEVDLVTLSHAERAKKLAYLSQSISDSFAYRVEDLVLLGSFQQLGSVDAKKRAVVILSELGIEHLRDRLITELSGGEQQLVHFARLLMQDADILLLDEPTASLDIGHEAEILGQLRRVTHDSNRCALLAIHNLNSAAEFCDRLLVLHEGKLIADGPPSLVLTPALIKNLYGDKAVVGRHPQTGSTTVLPVRQTRTQMDKTVHVIGGAGSAVLPSKWLIDLGYKITGGIAHEKDSDTLFWQQQNIYHITVPAFAEIDDEAFAQAKLNVLQADTVLLCDFPIGAGNKRNLELARYAKELIIIREFVEPVEKGEQRPDDSLGEFIANSKVISLSEFLSFFSSKAQSKTGAKE